MSVNQCECVTLEQLKIFSRNRQPESFTKFAH